MTDVHHQGVPTRLDHYRLLGRSGLRVSPLCLGTMSFGTDWGWGSDEKASREVFDAYTARGGNFIDTANFYTGGTSEKILGRLLGAERDRFVLATKYTLSMREDDPNAGGNHRKSMARSIDASLKRMDTDYIDLYWLHAWDYTTPPDEVMRALDDLVRAGKVLYLGISDTPAWKSAQCNTIAELSGWTRFIAQQVPYSLGQREPERDLIPMGNELGIATLPWSPLDGGILTGKYAADDLVCMREVRTANTLVSDQRRVNLTEKKLKIADTVKQVAQRVGRSAAQVALNWVLGRPGVVSPVIGARTVKHLEDNVGALDFRLDDEAIDTLDRVSAISRGFPHEMIEGDFVKSLIHGRTTTETRVP